MRDQGFHSPETLPKRAELHGLQKFPGALAAAEIERDHAAEAGHLFLREIVAGMVRQARIVNLLDFLSACEVLRDGHAIRIVRFHSHRKRLDTAQDEP